MSLFAWCLHGCCICFCDYVRWYNGWGDVRMVVMGMLLCFCMMKYVRWYIANKIYYLFNTYFLEWMLYYLYRKHSESGSPSLSKTLQAHINLNSRAPAAAATLALWAALAEESPLPTRSTISRPNLLDSPDVVACFPPHLSPHINIINALWGMSLVLHGWDCA